MESFKFNNVKIRFFERGDDVYYVTSDSNNAFGFKGDNTLLDRLSVQLDSLSKSIDHTFSPENLAKNTLVILLPELIKGVVRSKDRENLANTFVQMAANGFMTARVQKNQPLLPAVSDTDRMSNVAASVHRSCGVTKKIKASGEFLNWTTALGLLSAAVPDMEEFESYRYSRKFMRGLSVALANEYRSTQGKTPPTIRSKRPKSVGFGYPQAYEKLVIAFIDGWRPEKLVAQ
jgi:hypothetical protein